MCAYVMDRLDELEPEFAKTVSKCRPWGHKGAACVWCNDGAIYKVQIAGSNVVKQRLTTKEVERKYQNENY